MNQGFFPCPDNAIDFIRRECGLPIRLEINRKGGLINFIDQDYKAYGHRRNKRIAPRNFAKIEGDIILSLREANFKTDEILVLTRWLKACLCTKPLSPNNTMDNVSAAAKKCYEDFLSKFQASKKS